MNDKISIIVPVYNIEEEYLRECVDSLINQTYKNIEIILVDDGSINNSGTVCDQYADRDVRVKSIHQKNMGVSAARNRGIDEARGEWICFVDADDWLDLNTFEKMMDNEELSFCDVISFSVLNEGKRNNLVYDYSSHYYNVKNNLNYVIGMCLLNQMYWPNSFPVKFRNGPILTFPVNKLYKLKLINEKKIRFSTNILNGEDKLFNISLLPTINNLGFVNAPFYHYRYRATSATHKNGNILIQEVNKSIQKMYEVINAYGYMSIASSYFDKYITQNIWTLVDRCGASAENKHETIAYTKELRLLIESPLVSNALKNIHLSEIDKKSYQIVVCLLKKGLVTIAIDACRYRNKMVKWKKR